MTKKRVVVTGLGLVTPVGNNVQDSWSAIKAGKSGVRAVDAFDAATEVIGGVVAQVQTAIETTNNLIDANNRFAALQNRLIVQNAELTKELEEQKKISEDTTRSFDERSEALEKVIEANEQLVENALLEAEVKVTVVAMFEPSFTEVPVRTNSPEAPIPPVLLVSWIVFENAAATIGSTKAIRPFIGTLALSNAKRMSIKSASVITWLVPPVAIDR